MTELFPPIEPSTSGRLQLDALHSMYWEECGRHDGIPAVFLHGGPGSGASPKHRRFFDPQAYRIIVYDQRGAGRSTPLGELEDNTTPHLVADLEALRQHLGIERWLVFGGSWGSTLALAYAQAHPDRCLGLVLRGIFLCRDSEIDWFMRGMGTIFPEAWEAFAAHIPAAERGDLLQAYHRRLVDADAAVHMPAARAWSRYEGACSTLLPDPETAAHFDDDVVALGLAAHRGALLRQSCLHAMQCAARPDLTSARYSRRHRAGALRRGVSHRLGPRLACCLASGAVPGHPGCRALRLGARHPGSAACGDRALQDRRKLRLSQACWTTLACPRPTLLKSTVSRPAVPAALRSARRAGRAAGARG
jgi:proline iminopeptidase